MPGADDRRSLGPESRSVYQERSRRILEPGFRHHERPRRIGVAALIQPAHLAAKLFVFGQRISDVHWRADFGQREKTGRGFPVQADAAVGVRSGMDKSFVESIRGLEFTPVGHRITAIRFTGAATMLLLVVNSEIAGWRGSSWLTDVALDGHQDTIAFHYKKILGRERKFDLDLRRIVRFVRDDVIASGRDAAGHRTATRQEKSGRAAEAKEKAGKMLHS